MNDKETVNEIQGKILKFFHEFYLQSLVTITQNVIEISKENFFYSHCIGKGGFGKVWKVQKDKHNFAMKEMSKARIITK